MESYVQKEERQPISSEDIVRYIIKEEWVFDKQRSQMEKRIIGIAPVMNEFDEFGDIKGVKTMFWLYFPECEYVFQRYAALKQDFEPRVLTFTDLFRKRMFSTKVYQESSLDGKPIHQKNQGQDALLESERIKKQQETMEHDLWSY